jgi:3-deoxy-D-manno-octulosonic acid kinase
MSEHRFSAPSLRILYDSDCITAISPEWLNVEFWRLREDVVAELGGRGQALQIDSPAGPAVLRRYLRGGVVAQLSHDRFVFTGYDRSRAFREWRALKVLGGRGLPVPRPLMASCERSGIFYRAGILTELIPGTRSLDEAAVDMDETDWRRLAATLQACFAAGMIHADLNARNILVDKAGRWYLIDFDRARVLDRPAPSRRMLQRLFRSFDKLGVRDRRDLLQAG